MSFLPMAAASITGALLSRRGRGRQPVVPSAPSPEAGLTSSIAAQSDLMRSINRMMERQYSMAEPAYTTGIDYYSRLLRGGSALTSALQPELQRAREGYTGAERAIEAGNLRGPQRERSLAELARERAGTLSMIPAAARAGAAGSLTGLGAQGLGLAGTFAGQQGAIGSNIANIYNQMLQREQERKLANKQSWIQAGIGLAQIFLPWLLGQRGGSTQQGGGTT